MTEVQTSVLRLIQAMFNAAPNASILDEFSTIVEDSGGSTVPLANLLAANPVFTSELYSDSLSNTEFGVAFIDNIVGDAASEANKAWAANEITSLLNGGMSRGEVMAFAADELSNISVFNSDWGNAGIQFRNKVEVAGSYAIDEEGAGATLDILQAVTAAVTASSETVDAAIEAFTGSLEGVVVDGYVAGATVFVDIDGDGVQDPDEPSTTTDAQGNFTFPPGVNNFGQIVSSGGTDIATGLPFEGTLTAPAGSDVVNPLTTLIDEISKTPGATVESAKAQVLTALGLDPSTNLQTFDPIAASTDPNATAEEKALALKVQAAAVQVNTIVQQTAAVLQGTGTSTDGTAAAYAAVADAISVASSSAGLSTDPDDPDAPTSDGSIDLTSSTSISNIVKAAGQEAGATDDQQSQLDDLADDASTIITNLNSAVANAVGDGSGDVSDVLVEIAKVQVVSSNTADTVEEQSAGVGDISNAATNTSGDNLTNSIDAAEENLGDVDGDGQSNASTSSGGGGGGGGTPTTFTVTETAGVVEFGGTASGDITVVWSGTVGESEATFTQGGIEASTVPDFDTGVAGTATTITLATGQSLSMTLADATTLVANIDTIIDGDGSLVLTDTAPTAASLTTLEGDAKVDVTVDASAATTLTGTGAEFDTLIGTAGITLSGSYTANVSGTPTIANLNTIDADTSGAVTATPAATTLANLLTLTGTGNIYTLETTDAGTLAAADLTTLDGKTTVAIDATSAATLSGTGAELSSALGSAGINTAAGVALTVTGSITTAQQVTLDGNTTAAITATISDGDMTTLAGIVDANGNNALTITVTDTSVDAAALNTLDGKTSVNVDATAVTTLTGTGAAVNTAITAGTIDTAAGVNATVSDTIAASLVDTIAGATSGTVTATVSADTATSLESDLNGQTGAFTLTVTGVAVADDLDTLNANTTVTIDATGITALNGSTAEVLSVIDPGVSLPGNVPITLSDNPSVANANTIDAATTGVVTATFATAALSSFSTLSGTGNAYTVTINDAGTVAASDLSTLDGKTTVAVDATSAATLSGTGAELSTALGSAGITTTAGVALSVTGSITTAQQATLDGNTTAAVTATISDGDMTTLAGLADANGNNALTVTVTDTSADAAALNTLDGKTTVTVDATAVTTLTGTAAAAATAIAAGGLNIAANVAVNVNSGNASTAQQATLDGNTTGVVTATITEGDLTTLAGLANANANNALTVIVTDTTADAAALNTLDGKTSVQVDATATTTINGTAAAINTALAAGGLDLSGLTSVAPTGSITSAEQATMDGNTTLAITATISDNDMTSLASLADANGNNALTVTVTDASVDAAALNTLDGKTSVAITATAVGTLTGTASAIADALSSAGITTAAAVAASVNSGTATTAQQASIDGNTTGIVTATISDNDMATLAGIADAGGNNALTVTVTDTTVAAAALNTLDGKTTENITATSITTLTGTAADVATAVSSAGLSLDLGVGVTLDAGSVTAGDLDTVETNTTADVNMTAVTDVTLAQGESFSFDGTTVTGETFNLTGAGNNGGESFIVNNGPSGGTVDLSNITVDSDDVTVTFNGNSGVDDITATAAGDTITLAAGADTVTAGVGADTIDLGASDTDVDTVIQDAGDSADTGAISDVSGGGGVFADTDTIATTGADIVTNFEDGTDLIRLLSTPSAATQDVTDGDGGVGTGEFTAIRGDNSGGTFTVDTAAGADLLVLYDADGSGDIEMIVLSGSGAITFTAADFSQGVQTLNAATAAGTGLSEYHIQDTSSAIAALAAGVLNGATIITTTDAATISEATTISGATNSGATNINSVSDTANAISLSSNAVLDDVNGTVVASTDATVSEALLIAGFTKAVTFSVTDTVTNLASEAGDLSAAAEVTAQVQSGNTDLTDDTLDNDVTRIDLNGQSATLTVAQAGLTIVDIATGGSYSLTDTSANLAAASAAIRNGANDISATDTSTVAEALVISPSTNSGTTTIGVTDTVANLTGEVGDLSGLSGVTAQVQSGSEDITGVTFDSDVDRLDLNGQAAIINATQAGLSRTDGAGGGSFSISDTAANLAAVASGTLDAAVNLTASGTATVAQGLAIAGASNSGTTTVAVSGTVAELTTEIGDLSGASSVTAIVQSGDTDLTDNALDNDVTDIDLNGETVILTAAQAGLNITANGGTFSISDSVSGLTGDQGDLSAATTVTVVLASGGADANISGVTLDDDVDVIDLNGEAATMTLTQHQGFTTITAGGGSDQIDLTTAGAFTANAGIETYGIVGASNISINGSALSVNINGEAVTDQGVTVGSLTVDGDWALGTGNDVIAASTGADITGVNSGAATTAEQLNLTGTISMTQLQHAGLTTGITAGGLSDQVTVTTAGAVTTDADVETYSVIASSTVTVGTDAGHLAQVITEAGSEDNSTFVLGAGIYTGDWTGIDAADVVQIVNGTDISGNTGLNTGVTIDFQDAAASLTLNATQNGVVTFSNTTGSQTVIVSDDGFTADAGIENYTINGTSELTVNAAAPDVNITGDADDTGVVIGGLDVNGTWALGTGADYLTATTGADIAGVNAGADTTIEDLNLTGTITMTRLQHEAITNFLAGGGSDQINVSDAGAITAAAAIETYSLTGASNITVNGSGTGVNIIGDTGDQTVTVGGNTVSGTYALNTGTDVISATTGANISGVNTGTATTAETLAMAGTVTMTQVQHEAFTTINAAGVSDQITLTTAGAVTGDADIETYSIYEGSTLTLGAASSFAATNVIENNSEAAATTVSLGTGIFTGTYTAFTTTDIVQIVDGTDISGTTGLDSVIVDFQSATASVTLDAAQNGAVTFSNAGTGTHSVIVDEADTFSANAAIEAYTITGASNITVNAATNVTGDTGDQTVTVGGNTVTGTYALSTGTDVMSATNGADISGVNVGAATTAETLDMAGTVTMTRNQHEAFTTLTAAAGSDQVTLTDAGSLTAFSAIETYSLVENSTLTVGNVASGFGAINVIETGSNGDVTSVALGVGAYTGTFTDFDAIDVVQVVDGTDISGVTGLDSVVVDFQDTDGLSLTLDAAQHDGVTFNNVANSQTIVVSEAHTFNASEAVEAYTLTGASNITVSGDQLGVNLTGDGGDQTVTIGGNTVTGTYALGAGTDVISATTGADISGVNSGAVTTAESLTLADNASITMTAAQNDGFTGTITAGAAETIIISGNDDFTTLGNIETYTVGDDAGDNARTITVSAAGTSVAAQTTNDAVTFDLGGLTYTGTIDGDNTTADTLSLSTGADIDAGTINNVVNLTLADNASVTMSQAQHAAFSGIVTAGASETINITGDGSVTTLAAVESYSIGDDSTDTRTVTVSAAGTSVSATANDAVTFDLGSLVYTGTITGEGTTDDILSLADNANISGGTLSNVEALTLATDADVTMTRAQHEAFTGAITAGGTAESITLTSAGTVTALAAIETYDIVGASNITVNGSALGVSINGEDATDQTVTVGGNTVTGTYALGTGTDVISATTGANISGVNSGAATTAETIDMAGTVTMTRVQHEAFTTFTAAGGSDQITLTTAGALTLDSAIESYSLVENSTVIVGPAASGFAAINVTETGSNGDVTSVTLGAGAYTGTWTDFDTTDQFLVADGTDISGVTGLDSVAIDFNSGGGTLTIDAAQLASLTYLNSGGVNTIAVSEAVTFTANAAIESYTLTGASNITVNAATGVSGDGSDQTVTVGGNTVTGTYALGVGTDVISATDGADITGVNSGAVTTAESLTLADNASITMTAAQNDGFTGTITAGAAETIIISGNDDFTTLGNIETYTVGDDAGDNARTITVSAAATSVAAQTANDAVTFDLGALTYTGTIDGENTTADTISLSTGADIDAATINNVVNLTLASGASVTMSQAQHAAFSGSVTAAGTETINITGDGAVTTLSAIENYSIGDDSGDSRTVTVSAAGTDVTASSGTDAVTFDLGALTYTGNITGDVGVDDILSLDDNADISGGAISNVEALTLATDADVTMTRAQHEAFTGAITAGGTAESITLTTAGTVTGLAAIESYVLGGTGANTITIGAAAQDVTTASDATNQAINTGSITNYTGTITGNATDTTVLEIGTDGTDVSGATLNIGASSGVEVLAQGSNGVTLNSTQHGELIGVSATDAITGTGTVTIDTNGTITADASPSAYILTGLGASTITLAAAAQNITTANVGANQTVDLGSLTSYTGTFTGNGTATDILTISTDATDISSATLTSVDQVNLANDVDATMTKAFHDLINTGTGDNTVTFTDAVTGAASLSSVIESFVLVAGANSLTTTTAAQSINADALLDAEVLTMAGSTAASVSLVAGDLAAGSYSGGLTVTATTGTNVITTGSGNDNITGGAGNDTITTNGGTDTIVFADTAANNGEDTILDFTTTSDSLDFSAFETAGSTVAVTGALTTTAGTVYYLTGGSAGDADSAAAAAAALNTAATWTDADATAWIVISDDNSAAVYEWADTAASGDEVATGELTLIATITGTVASGDLTI